MAIEREILQDITKYKAKFIGPFTTRQAACIGITAAIVIPLYLIGRTIFTKEFLFPCLILIGTPVMLCGFYMPYDMPLERFIVSVLFTFILSPPTRRYKRKSEMEVFFEPAMPRDKPLPIKNSSEIKKRKAKIKSTMPPLP